jgi:very-short-patch-repair endonuclease
MSEVSYKNRMHPTVSNAELELFKALSAQGLTHGMLTQKPIILKSTIPDFCWPEKRKVLYLDGAQVHRKDKARERDEEIDELLELQGWEVLRIPYDPPLTAKALQEIMATIKKFLGVNEDPEE